MKILYKQNDISKFCISNCYLKHILVDRDFKNITKKVHHHTDFEVHLIQSGSQIYEMNGTEYTISPGEYIIIPPHTKHRLSFSAPDTLKYSITFNIAQNNPLLPLAICSYSGTGAITSQISENLQFITEEFRLKRTTSFLMIENRVFETIILLLRTAGMKESDQDNSAAADSRIIIAKQYIDDNVELNLTTSDVAKYCYLSPKQLSRLFLKYEDISLADYIKKQRIQHAAELLSDDTLSLKDISEKLNFNNEHYFNSFIKKHLGMPPGAFRKMLK